MKLSSKSASDLFKLGIYQLAGAIIGIVVIVWTLFTNPFFNSIIIALFVLVILAFTYSIACGILCLRQHSKALHHSLINQCLQLISLSIAGFSFYYAAGFFVHLGFDFTNRIEIGAEFGISGFSFNYNSDSGESKIYINIIALLLIVWIIQIRKRIKEEQMLQGLL